MTAETLASARATLHMPLAPAYLQWLMEHLQQEGVQVTAGSGPASYRLMMDSVGTLELNTCADEMLECEVWPVDAPMLALIKMSLLEHAQEFLSQQQQDPQRISIVWSDAGDEDALARPGFQRLRVLQRTNITARMRRFRLQAEHLPSLIDGGGLHLRLLLPAPGQPALWPTMGREGRLQYPESAPPLPQRIYTIVHSHVQEGWIEIDMLRHGHAASAADAPGSHWADMAQPGDEVGAITPAGGRLHSASRMVLVADNCALPALARQLQNLAPDAQVQVIAMVEDAAEIRSLPLPEDHKLRWLVAPSPQMLLQTMERLRWQDSSPERLWAACGDAHAKALRHWVRERQPQLRSQISSYWR